MPYAPARLCSFPGCTTLAKHSHRASHEDRRASAAKRGYGRHHERWRVMVLNRDRFCKSCETEGRVTLATDADHIVPLAKGGSWSLDNGQGLCASCHSRKTRAENHFGGSRSLAIK